MRRDRRRREPPPWEKDWRNPHMKVLRSYVVADGLSVRRVVEEMTPEQSSELSAENIEFNEDPDWRRDPSYHWSRKGKRR